MTDYPPEHPFGQEDEPPDEGLLAKARARLAEFLDDVERAAAEQALRRAEDRASGRG